MGRSSTLPLLARSAARCGPIGPPAARALARLAGSGYHDARVLREPGRRSVPIGAEITGGPLQSTLVQPRKCWSGEVAEG